MSGNNRFSPRDRRNYKCTGFSESEAIHESVRTLQDRNRAALTTVNGIPGSVIRMLWLFELTIYGNINTMLSKKFIEWGP